MTDVNTAFADTRARQIADAEYNSPAARVARGELADLGGGRYRVLTGWDAGETLYLSEGVLIPQHGLDVNASGQAALYSAVPAWHGLGQIIPGGITSVERVLDLGGLDFTVELRPALTRWGEDIIEVPGRSATVRTDTGAPLGTVGNRYRPIQNAEAFGFLQALIDDDMIVWESAGTMDEGRKVFVTARLPEDLIVDPGGIADPIRPFLVMTNAHDGTGAAQVVLTPWRIVCRNTERFALRDASARWSVRHTSGALDGIKEARKALGLTHEYYASWEQEETALARTDMAIGEFRKAVDEIWPVDEDASARVQANADERRTALTRIFDAEADQVGRTAYAAERAVTAYLDHLTPVRPPKTMTEDIARGKRVIEGNDDDLKTRAHHRLMRLVGGGVERR